MRPTFARLLRACSPLWPLALCLAVWGVLWVLLFIILPPGRQEFPLNDDWAFSKGVFEFARGEGLHYQGWASMPLLGQWLWAFPFVRLLGESHVALSCGKRWASRRAAPPSRRRRWR